MTGATPKRVDLHAREQRRLDVHHGLLAGPHRERIRADDGRAFEQGVQNEAVGALGGPFDPKLGEYGELLALGAARPQRETASGEAVELLLRDGSEVACALKDEKLVEDIGSVDRCAHAETGIAHVRVELDSRRFRPVVKSFIRKKHATGLAAHHEIDIHRSLVDEAGMKQVDRERAVLARPYRCTSLEPNRTVLIVGESFLAGRQFRLDELLFRQLGGARDENVAAERR